jgi:hypothetical protein
LQHIWGKKKKEKLQKIKIKLHYNWKHTEHLIQPFEKKIHQNNQVVNLCYNYVIRYSWHGIGTMTLWAWQHLIVDALITSQLNLFLEYKIFQRLALLGDYIATNAWFFKLSNFIALSILSKFWSIWLNLTFIFEITYLFCLIQFFKWHFWLLIKCDI